MAKYNVKIYLRCLDANMTTSDVEISDEARDSGAWLKGAWLTMNGSNNSVTFQTAEIAMIEMTPVKPVSEPK